MDRDGLQDRIGSFMHVGSAHQAEILLWIEDARLAIGTDLRSDSNLTSASVTMASGTGTRPTDLKMVRNFYGPDGQALEYASPDYAAAWRDETGTPVYYTVTDTILAYPIEDSASYTLEYFQDPAELTAAGTENAVLTAHPLLYQYAVMRLVALWQGDGDLMREMGTQYDNEIRRINTAFKRAHRGSDAVVQSTHSFTAGPVAGV